MLYDLNAFFHFDHNNQSNSRVLVYPNQEIAAKLLNHTKERGAKEINVAECIPEDASRLPMPHILMETIDGIIRNQSGYFVVIGLDAYLALLTMENIAVFTNELRSHLDENDLHVDYLLSANNQFHFSSRYEESRKVVFLSGTEETPTPLHIRVFHKKWTRPGEDVGFPALLRRMASFNPGGEYTVFLPDVPSGQPELGRAVTFVTDIHAIAVQLYGFDIPHVDDIVLERLLLTCMQCNQTPDSFLSEQFGEEYCNPRLALKRLVALRQDELWPAYVWYIRKFLPNQSYMMKVLTESNNSEELLWNYTVGTARSVLSDVHAKKYAQERADAIKAITDTMQIEPFILEFINIVRERDEALQFLNCGTYSEKVEIIRRAKKEASLYKLPWLYGELYPVLVDYLSPFNWGNSTIATYFQEYRKLKLLDTLTETFALQAYNTSIPSGIPTRDSVLAPLRQQTDTALLVVELNIFRY